MKNTTYLFGLTLFIVVLFALNLAVGTIEIPMRNVWLILWGEDNQQEIWRNIVIRSRLPQALTAMVAGAGLAVSGAQMQTVFRNPLAGPSVLGVSSGATLGVGFVVLLSGSLGGVALSRLGYLGDAAMSVAAHWRFGCIVTHSMGVTQGEGQCHPLGDRCDDWLSGYGNYWCTEILQQ